MTEIKGKRFLIYGDGLSGRAAKHAIKKRGGKVTVVSDVKGKLDLKKHYDCAIISPGITPRHAVYAYCENNGIPTMGEAELGIKLAGRPVIAVTGTNGKTTVTRLIADMTGGTACGNIGYPVCKAIDKSSRVLVCELSSFQLYNADISPKIAVITNIEDDHADWHGSREEYIKSKLNIAAKAETLILGEDIKVGALQGLNTSARVLMCSSVSHTSGAYLDGGIFYYMGERVCAADYLSLQGEHNIKNALCAIAAAKTFGADDKNILAALARAKGGAHRIERVGNYCGKLWIDDSKGTNVSACLAAVETTCGTVCLIVGGRDKALDFTKLFEKLPPRVTEVVAMGESAQKVRDSMGGYCGKLTVVNGLKDAVKAASLSQADTVLLSPACASFDEFKNYAQRGERFKAEVAAIDK